MDVLECPKDNWVQSATSLAALRDGCPYPPAALGQSGMSLSALRGPIDHLRTIGDALECPKIQLGTVLGQSGMSLNALRGECHRKHPQP